MKTILLSVSAATVWHKAWPILVAILFFGLIIAIHELGHFLSAKLFGVKVNEFSLGMGPAIFKKQKGETKYSLRCRQRREYLVSPFCFLKIAGPIPRENSLTLTPKSFAERKCPSSWIAIIKPKKRIATRIGQALCQTVAALTERRMVFKRRISPFGKRRRGRPL